MGKPDWRQATDYKTKVDERGTRTNTTIEEETTQGKQPPGRRTPEEQERKEAEPIQSENTEQVHPGKRTPERRGKARRGDPGGPTEQLGRVGTLQQKLRVDQGYGDRTKSQPRGLKARRRKTRRAEPPRTEQKRESRRIEIARVDQPRESRETGGDG